MHIHMNIHIHIHIQIHIHIHIHIHIQIHIHIHIHIPTYIYTYIHIHTYIHYITLHYITLHYIHTYITYTYIYIYTYNVQMNLLTPPFRQGTTQMARDEASRSMGLPQTPPQGSPRNCLGTIHVYIYIVCMYIDNLYMCIYIYIYTEYSDIANMSDIATVSSHLNPS